MRENTEEKGNWKQEEEEEEEEEEKTNSDLNKIDVTDTLE